MEIVRFGPTIAKHRGALSLACLDCQTRPALRRHLGQHSKAVKALIEDDGFAGRDFMKGKGVAGEVAGGGLFDIVQSGVSIRRIS